jgi:hypothetical protein
LSFQQARARKWYIYAVVIEPEPGEFLVKFGASTDPLRRVAEFRQGLPLKPTILWACANSRSSAFKIERRIHKEFKGRRTFGEWFKFGIDDKQLFKEVPRVEYLAAVGEPLNWSVTSCEEWLQYVNEAVKSGKTKILPGHA